MRGTRRLVVRWTSILSFVVALHVAGTCAQEPADEVSRELAGIRASLERIVGLLEQQTRHQETELLIRRITIRERRLEPLETRLRDAEAELRGSRDELERLRTMIQGQEVELDTAVTEGRTDEETMIRTMLKELREAIRREEPLVDAMELRVRDLEDRVAEEREEIEVLDDLLLERFE